MARRSHALDKYPLQPQQFFDELVSLSVSLADYPYSPAQQVRAAKASLVPYGSWLFAGMSQFLGWKRLTANQALTHIIVIAYNPQKPFISYSPYTYYDTGLGGMHLDQSRFVNELEKNNFVLDPEATSLGQYTKYHSLF